MSRELQPHMERSVTIRPYGQRCRTNLFGVCIDRYHIKPGERVSLPVNLTSDMALHIIDGAVDVRFPPGTDAAGKDKRTLGPNRLFKIPKRVAVEIHAQEYDVHLTVSWK